jgi:predicted nucleic acid-binding Zn ribbon protein
METTERDCLACGKAVKGRVDKKFCDDYCRNAFNNRQNSDQNNYVRNINNILRKNRRLLELVIPAGEGMGKCARKKLADQGFNFKYHTHQYTNRKGDTYHFCYDFGYLPLEGEWLLIVKRKEEHSQLMGRVERL